MKKNNQHLVPADSKHAHIILCLHLNKSWVIWVIRFAQEFSEGLYLLLYSSHTGPYLTTPKLALQIDSITIQHLINSPTVSFSSSITEQPHHHPKNQTFLPGLSSSVSGQSPGYTYKSDAIQKQAANTRWLSFKTQTLFQSFLHQVPRPVPRLLKLKIWGKPLWPHLNPGSWIWPITGAFLWQSDCFDHWQQVNSYQTPVNYSAGRTLRRGISLFPPIFSLANIAFNDNMCENVWHNLFLLRKYPPSKQLNNWKNC